MAIIENSVSEPKYSGLVQLMELITKIVLENNAEKSVDYNTAKEIIGRMFGSYKYPITEDETTKIINHVNHDKHVYDTVEKFWEAMKCNITLKLVFDKYNSTTTNQQ